MTRGSGTLKKNFHQSQHDNGEILLDKMEEWKQKITYKDALEQKLIEFEKELRAEGLIDKLTSFQNSKNFPISVFRTYGLFISEFKDSKRNLELKGDKSFSR